MSSLATRRHSGRSGNSIWNALFQQEPSRSTPAERMLGGNPSQEFLNASREWRRIFAEFWGTLLLVVGGAGVHVAAAASNGPNAATLAAAVVPGLTVMSVIYFMGSVSGAHINPAVTLAFALRSNFPWMRVPGYILAQISGAVASWHRRRMRPVPCEAIGICAAADDLLGFPIKTVRSGIVRTLRRHGFATRIGERWRSGERSGRRQSGRYR